MKRGLVLLDPAEITADEWRGRVAAVQRELAADGTDVALIYGDVSRSDDIAYLTNLCVYWNEGILAVPAHGDPVFLTKLSPRVHPWMRRISTLTEIRSGGNLAELVARFLGPADGRAVGLVEAELWPAAVAAQLRLALAGWDVRPLAGLVRALRQLPSSAEIALLRHAAAALAATAAGAAAPGLTDHERIAAAERGLRGDGFLDVLADTARTADGATSVRITGQYRYLWLQASRVTATGTAAWPDLLREAIAIAVTATRPGATAADLELAARPYLDRLPAGATSDVRWVHHADMATNGEYADYPSSLPIPAGSVVVVGIDVRFVDGTHAAVAETVLAAADGPVCLTGQPGTVGQHGTAGAGRPVR
jgi:Xaa-Pro aminopeptidase